MGWSQSVPWALSGTIKPQSAENAETEQRISVCNECGRCKAVGAGLVPARVTPKAIQTWMDRMVRIKTIQDLRFQISNLKSFILTILSIHVNCPYSGEDGQGRALPLQT
jgi:hypothetical protein